jgi:hypothetical protein
VAALLHANTAAAAAAGGPGVNGVSLSKHSSKKACSQQGGDTSKQQGLAGAVMQGLADADISTIRIYAFDKDPKRLKRLAANVDRAGAGGIVVPQRADFLTIDPLDPQFKQVMGHGVVVCLCIFAPTGVLQAGLAAGQAGGCGMC